MGCCYFYPCVCSSSNKNMVLIGSITVWRKKKTCYHIYVGLWLLYMVSDMNYPGSCYAENNF